MTTVCYMHPRLVEAVYRETKSRDALALFSLVLAEVAREGSTGTRQTEFAERLGVSRHTILRAEKELVERRFLTTTGGGGKCGRKGRELAVGPYVAEVLEDVDCPIGKSGNGSTRATVPGPRKGKNGSTGATPTVAPVQPFRASTPIRRDKKKKKGGDGGDSDQDPKPAARSVGAREAAAARFATHWASESSAGLAQLDQVALGALREAEEVGLELRDAVAGLDKLARDCAREASRANGDKGERAVHSLLGLMLAGAMSSDLPARFRRALAKRRRAVGGAA